MSGGIGYAHAMPPARQPIRQRQAIDARWTSRWWAWASSQAKAYNDPTAAVLDWRHTHTARTRVLLDAGLPWTTIMRRDLDNPFASDLCFNGGMQNALARRAKRVEWVKGQVKKREENRKVNE